MHSTNTVHQLYARLDKKTERRVLCAHTGCDGQIAEVLPLPQGYILRAPEGHMYEPYGIQEEDGDAHFGEFDVRLVVFAPGWLQEEDGTWHLSSSANNRMQKGYRPYRHELRKRIPGALSLSTIVGMMEQSGDPHWPKSAIRKLDQGKELDHRQCMVLYFLPNWATCPQCDRRQVLDAAVLKTRTDLRVVDWPYIPEQNLEYDY